MIELHYVATPNGLKVALLLEELGLPYQVKSYDIFAGEHLNAEFRKINPNSRLPAIVDHAPSDKSGPLSVFESGAVLIYLAEKTGRFLASDPRRGTVFGQRIVYAPQMPFKTSGLGSRRDAGSGRLDSSPTAARRCRSSLCN
jgi:glutathione S-transferase